MKPQKPQELRNLSNDELGLKIKNLKEELYKLNQLRYTTNVEKPHRFSRTKREIARIETILTERKNAPKK